MDGDSSLCSSLFTKYKISIFFLFLSPIPRETTHKSLKRRLLHLSFFLQCAMPPIPYSLDLEKLECQCGIRRHMRGYINNMTRVYSYNS